MIEESRLRVVAIDLECGRHPDRFLRASDSTEFVDQHGKVRQVTATYWCGCRVTCDFGGDRPVILTDRTLYQERLAGEAPADRVAMVPA